MAHRARPLRTRRGFGALTAGKPRGRRWPWQNRQFAPPRPLCQIVLLLKLVDLADGQFEDAKIKAQNAKLWNPDPVGTVVLIVVLFLHNYY